MTEEWAACIDCTQFVISGEWYKLAERALMDHPLYALNLINPQDKAEVIRTILGLHKAFQRSRLNGPPCPVELVKVRR